MLEKWKAGMCAYTHKRTTFLHEDFSFALASQVCTGAILHFCHDVDPLFPFSFSDAESFGHGLLVPVPHGVLVPVNPNSKDVQLQVVCAITRINKQLVWKF